MAARANAGEMRTRVRIAKPAYTIVEGFERETFTDVFSRKVKVKWVYAHGSEIYQAAEQQIREPATITMRYSPLVNVECRIWRENDPNPYEIISINNVEDCRQFLEIKVKRVVTA